ncbi:MAG: twin-arginine translocation signal domain-containing protein [Alistipes sp.]|nr:twin-arginine translocation signal domain-containing protein [Alistipes sp.]
MDRRDFLKYSVSAATGVLLTPLARAGCYSPKTRIR